MSKQVVRVNFMDGSAKAFGIDANTTAEQLRQQLIDRIDLHEDGCFALFEKKGDWERCIEPDERPVDIMKSWPSGSDGKESKKDKKDSSSEPHFLFKKKIFLKDDEQEMGDETAKNLVYIQALHNVITSQYPCTAEDTIRLAGLQAQVVFGDHNSSTHVAGFLTSSNRLKEFVPQALFSMKKPSEWETLILKAHYKNKGKSAEEAKTEYLQIVKRWDYYGMTFFPPCRTIKQNSNKSSQPTKVPSKVVIGVNYEGIRLMRPKTKEILSDHPFYEICSWASSSGTFAFEFGNQNLSQKYTFETKHGSIIASTIQTYIDILVQMLKNGDEDDDDDGEDDYSDGSDDDSSESD